MRYECSGPRRRDVELTTAVADTSNGQHSERRDITRRRNIAREQNNGFSGHEDAKTGKQHMEMSRSKDDHEWHHTAKPEIPYR
ncbi:hypothetical protein CSOJ01_01645 [Colletotrichum sojae]|uniref:Uncharacterized protein n=1 Tax=Colletotrichum sojae TaxID=2175907 RepID=A0A8H6N475_9PEZI|nr:hypothetical protein CSOJ01_01645 [Colletotrichum sojae]